MHAFLRAQAIVALLCFVAEPAIPAEKRVALVIGNANYAHTTAHRNAANDATLVARTLSEIGFTEVLEHKDLDMAPFRVVLERFAVLTGTSDWALVYYAGHAVELGGATYLVPIDAKLESAEQLAHEGIALERVLENRARPRLLSVLILDTPRTNPFRGGVQPPAYRQPEGDVLIAHATQPGNGRAASQGDNGPFALSLVRHIATPGLDVEQVFHRVRLDVMSATNGKQIPWTHASLRGRYEFMRLPR